jgi:hypothetical protein
MSRALSTAHRSLWVFVLTSSACGIADNAGPLDVLSTPRDASVADATRDASACSILNLACTICGVACNICIGTNRCLGEYTACIADPTCGPALSTVVGCACQVQSTDAGSLRSCDDPFRASAPLAVKLADCMAHGCALECGLTSLTRDAP